MSGNQILEEALKQKAAELGFDACNITSAQLSETAGDHLETFVERDRHGQMGWMETTLERRKKPSAMWPEAVSAIMLGMNYGPEVDPMETLGQSDNATLSVYARNRDYHDLIKGKLKTLAGWFASKSQHDVKVFVDTAPLMEKPLAHKSGLGWQGKHTNLVSRDFGSWLFLGAILTTAELTIDEASSDHCGTCQSCLDICPTNAFPAPYQLDARRCISYLTIEHDGPIPLEFREPIGNRIYGCDDCLAVCPWNKYAQATNEAKLTAREDLLAPSLTQLAGLDDQAFRKFFSGSPIKRIGRNRFLRNVLIALGNSNAGNHIETVKPHLSDPDPMVRGAAVWAMYNLSSSDKFAEMKHSALKTETDADVVEEWNQNAQ